VLGCRLVTFTVLPLPAYTTKPPAPSPEPLLKLALPLYTLPAVGAVATALAGRTTTTRPVPLPEKLTGPVRSSVGVRELVLQQNRFRGP